MNQFNVNANYFLPGRLGGDHAFNIGGYWKDAYSSSYNHTGGYATRSLPDRRGAGERRLLRTRRRRAARST